MQQKSHPLFSLLVRTRLFPRDEAKRIYQTWLSDTKGQSRDPAGFGKWLTSKKYLTSFQASLLSRQLTHGYFLQQYKILERVGRGRMAGVYRAVHEVGQIVAIKILPPSRASDPQLLARFQREAKLALRLQHPNIVRAFHMGQADGCHFLVMEYLEGESLEEVLEQKKKLPAPEAAHLVFQALQGLQHIHEKGLVHRDLKPANLMLSRSFDSKEGVRGQGSGVRSRAPGAPGLPPVAPQGQGPEVSNQRSGLTPDPWPLTPVTVKILDIGLGRALFDETLLEKNDDEKLTGVEQILGTPDYMSPEQARDARLVDIRSDIYSLGCVLYHALAGQPPFPDTNVINQMVRHATEAPRKLKTFNAEIPGDLQHVVERMMAKDPAKRYPTPERAAQALKPIVEREAWGVEREEQGVSPHMSRATPHASDDATARSYLEWLQNEGEGSEARSQKSEVRSQESEEGVRGQESLFDPGSMPATNPGPAPLVPEPVVDVELEPLCIKRTSLLSLTRRDFLMLGLGASGILLAVFCGWLLAKIFGGKARRG